MHHLSARGRLSPEALDAFRAGDDSFFRELIRLHEYHLRIYCRRFAADEDEEDELLQATIVRAWERRASYTACGTIEGWLFTVARKLCHQTIVGRRRRIAISAIVDAVAPEPPDEIAARQLQDMEDDRLSIVLRLSPRRLLVTLHRLGFDYSVAQTATALDVSPGTVKATLHQAIKWLEPHVEAGRYAESMTASDTLRTP